MPFVIPKIDAHTHVFGPSQRDQRALIAERDATFAEMYANAEAKMADGQQLLRALDGDGFDGAVVAGFAFSAPADLDAQNDHILSAAAGSNGRLVPLATVNLAFEGWRSEAESALARGARGFGELRPHNQGWDPLGPAAHELCELAAAREAVLLWHVSEPVGHSYPGKAGGIGPVELIRLAEAHPDTKMVAAHLGGGLSFYLQMPEMRLALRRIWFDTAASFLLYDDGSVSRLVGLAGVERVLFASDYPLLSPGRQLERVLRTLPEGTAEAVCGGNAKTLFSDTRNL